MKIDSIVIIKSSEETNQTRHFVYYHPCKVEFSVSPIKFAIRITTTYGNTDEYYFKNDTRIVIYIKPYDSIIKHSITKDGDKFFFDEKEISSTQEIVNKVLWLDV